MIHLLAALVAFLVAALLNHYLSRPGSRLAILSYPNHRSLHTEPRPQIGGIAILSGFFSGLVFLWTQNAIPLSDKSLIWIGLILAAGVSFLDDKYALPPKWRFLIQTACAILVILDQLVLTELVVPGLPPLPLHGLSLVITLLFILWMMNLYNFMDGMDGFSGGMGAFGFGYLALLGWMAGATPFFAMTLLLAAANVGFLLLNFPAPKSRIFMGDVGAVPMGFLAALFSLWGTQDGIFPFWIAVMIFSPFILDASITLIRRGRMGKKIWMAHHSHYYQRLVRLGWTHRKVVLYEYLLMSGCGSLAIFLHASNQESTKVLGVMAGCMVYVILAVLIDKKTAHIPWD